MTDSEDFKQAIEYLANLGFGDVGYAVSIFVMIEITEVSIPIAGPEVRSWE